MDLFPRTFLLVFSQLAVGGMFALAIPPFTEIDRGYYKSSALIYLLFGTLAWIGRLTLWWGSASPSGLESLEIALWAVFLACGSGYYWTLRSEPYVLRARLFAATWIVGLLALVVAALSFRPPAAPLVGALVYALSFVVSAFLLGSVVGGMLLGHWYLIDRDLSLEPLNRVLAFYIFCLLAQPAVFVIGGLLLSLAGGAEVIDAFGRLAGEHSTLLLGRLASSPVGAGILAWMIRRTLQIPQTMAATGLFYIAILAVLVGELMGRFILFRTGLPL